MPRKSIVLIIDGLRASWLGPYGNTWFETPAANALAAESTLFQSCVINAPELEAIYHRYWHGGQESPPSGWRLPVELQAADTPMIMITDDPHVADLADQARFSEVHEAPEAEPGCSSPDIASMAGSLTVGTALEYLARRTEGDNYCCWVHMQGLAGFWDAPPTLRQSLAEQEEADVPASVRPPEHVAADLDPDLRFGWLVAAAAQVQAIDQCLGMMMEAADREGALLVLAGARGYPLGEHGRAGLKTPTLHGELLHVPLLVREPKGGSACRRDHRLVQCEAIGDIVRRWHQGMAPCEMSLDAALLPDPSAQLAISRSGPQLAIRTAAWFARLDAEALELYSKPDDQFEVNEVADRCIDEVEAMQQIAQALFGGAPLEQIELPHVLWNPIR